MWLSLGFYSILSSIVIAMFRPFTINVIIDIVRFRSVILLFVFFLYPLFTSPMFLFFLALFWII